MQNQSTHDLLETLAGELVLIDCEDLPALADLHTKFQLLADTPEAQQYSALQLAAQGCAALVEKIILREVDDAAQALETIGETISAIQSVVRDGRDAEEVSFPDLGVDVPQLPEAGSEFEDVPEPAVAVSELSLPANVEPSVFAGFITNQSLAVEEMEQLILNLEKPDAGESLEELTRMLHTLKGEAGMMGLQEIEHLCHQTETALAGRPASELTDQLLSVKDWLQRSLDSYAGKGAAPGGLEDLLKQLQVMPAAAATRPLSVPTGADDLALLEEFIAEAREHLDAVDVHLLTVESAPDDEEALNAIFRAFHTIKGVAGFLDLRDVMEVAHEAENLLDLARKRSLQMVGPAVDVTFAAADTLARYVGKWSHYLSTKEPPVWEPAHQALISRIQLVASGQAEEVDGETAPLVSPVSTAAAGSRPVVERKEVLKVDAKRLDRIVDAIGELVIAVSMVRQSVATTLNSATNLPRQMAHLEKITRELQEMGTSLRMVPIRPVFQKMARLARDLAKKVDKRVEFVMSGEDTELDKTVVDQISDPLVHMIRNAVDHGLESDPAERIQQGKSEKGTVELRAFHQGGNIIVEVSDDGRGLDKEAIIRKAKDRGLLSEGDQISDQEAFNLIFHPGLSTAKNVTDVSGRGVGMDVVRKNIESLRGHVHVSSEPGKGTKFHIVLPLTLAIIDGMTVRVGNERYIVPTLSIVASLRPDRAALSTVFGRGEMLKFQNELVPLTRLHRLFGISDAQTDPTRGLVVLVDHQGRKTGLLVDELLGQQQIVIKSLGETMRGLPGVAGGAIMPDGNVGLILDVAGLIEISKSRDVKECA